MLRLSRKSLLAVEAVLDVALHARPDPVQSRDITRRQGIPQRYLEQVMQQLVHQGILKGIRGPRGGYLLARERRRITVGEIVRVIDTMERAADEEAISQSRLAVELIGPIWSKVERELLERLDAITLDELSTEAINRDLSEKIDVPDDFTI